MRVTLFRLPALIAVTAAASLTLAACGSSSATSATGTRAAGSSTTGTAGAATRRGMTAQAQACLKQQGVTVPSRPAGADGAGGPPQNGSGRPAGAPEGGGGGGFGATMTDAQRAKLQAAMKTCGVSFGAGRGAPYGGPRPNTDSAAYRAAVTKYTACVRTHGYDLPDPDFSGDGPIFAAKIQQDATFQAASKQCQSLLSATS
jgi:hypothetical protein